MRKAPPRAAQKPIGLIVGALALVIGAFLFASGSLLDGSGSLLSAVMSAFSSKPTIVISRSSTSPSGVIASLQNQNLATFNVKVSNVKWQGVLNSITVSVPVTGQPAKFLTVEGLAAHYTYCVPNGVKYGYGYKGGSCGTIDLTPSTTTRNGNTYTLTFTRPIPVYPQQSYGAFVVSGKPVYTSSAAVGTGLIEADITAATAIGDQCRTVSYGYKNSSGTSKQYSYSKCGNVSANVSLFGARGNLLKVKNPYGYTYPVKKPTPTPTPVTTTGNTSVTTQTTHTSSATQTGTTGTSGTTGTTGSTGTTSQSSGTTGTTNTTQTTSGTSKGGTSGVKTVAQ